MFSALLFHLGEPCYEALLVGEVSSQRVEGICQALLLFLGLDTQS